MFYRNTVILCLLSLTGINSSAQWKVGAASAVINPPDGSYIAGHTQNRRFTGVHDNLYIKSLVIANKSENITIVTVDCIGLLYPQLQEIRKKVAAKISKEGFNPEHIVLSSTHTHAGPDVVGIWGPDLMHSGVDSAYIQFLVDAAAQQIIKSWLNRVEASADYSVTEHGEGWVYNISQPEELDRTLTAIRFKNKKGISIASLTNFACHPTFVDGVHDKVSSDYVAGFYGKMDSVLGGVNLFLQGAIGGWVQPEHEPKTFEQALMRGRGLAEANLLALSASHQIKGKELDFRSEIINLPVENMGFRQLAEAGVIKRKMTDQVETELAIFRIGNGFFATHPGETVPAMSMATRKMMVNDGPKFVMGLSMDALGYILKPEFFDQERKIPHAAYLCSMSTGQQTGPKIIQKLEELFLAGF
jgi:hypothetical protein